MYRLIVESLLGLRLEENKLFFEPCFPADWDIFTIHYRYRETIYHIKVRQKQAGEKEATTVALDGVLQEQKAIALVDDGQEHTVEVCLENPTSNYLYE